MLTILMMAQAVAAAAPEAAAQEGVISYPPAFFAAQQPQTALDMLRRVPAFTVDTGDSVRGFEGAAGNVLIDGKRPASKTDSLEDILTRIPAGQVERIDIIRGGAPGIDMQGKTVLANVVRRKSSGVRGALALSDLHMTDGRGLIGGRLELAGKTGEVDWEGSLRYGRGLDDGQGDGYGTRIFADGSPTTRAIISSEGDSPVHIIAGSAETPLAGGRLRVNGRLYFDRFKSEEEYRIYDPFTALETNLYLQDTDETEIGGRYNRSFGVGTDLELVGLRQTRDRGIQNVFTADGSTSDFRLGRYSVETIGRGTLRRTFNPTLSVEAGGEVALNTLESGTNFAVDATSIPLPAANVEVEELRSEAILKATWKPSSQWTVDGGLRYESSTISSSGDVVLEKSLHFLKPRLAVTYAPSATRQIRTRIEREVSQLNFDDFVASSSLNTGGGVQAGNPDLNPQQAWVAEAAFEQRFWESGVVVLTLRRAWLTDVIDRGPVFLDGEVFDAPQNIGDGKQDQVILEVTLPLARVGLKGAQLKGDITRTWSEVTDPTTHTFRGISGQRPRDWNVSFSYDLPQWNLTWGFDAFGSFKQTSYRFDSIEVFKLNTYVRPYVEWRPPSHRGLSVRFEASNVTQRDLRDTFYLYPGPRNLGGTPDIDDRYITDTGAGFAIRLRQAFGA